MEAFIIPGAVSILLLSLNGPTTLQFDEQIEFIQAGKAGEISLTIASNKKTVVLQPLIPLSEQRNMVILTKGNSFNLNYRVVDKDHHQFLLIRHGEPDSSFNIKLENEDYKILEGKRSYLVQNKKPNQPLIFNGTEIRKNTYFSKGLPLFNMEGGQIVK